MSLLSFLFSLDSGGKGGGRAVKSCLCVGCKTYDKINVGQATTPLKPRLVHGAVRGAQRQGLQPEHVIDGGGAPSHQKVLSPPSSEEEPRRNPFPLFIIQLELQRRSRKFEFSRPRPATGKRGTGASGESFEKEKEQHLPQATRPRTRVRQPGQDFRHLVRHPEGFCHLVHRPPLQQGGRQCGRGL